MDKITSWLRNLSFGKKLKLSYYLVILIPTIMFGSLFIYNSVTYLSNQLVQEANNKVDQNILDIESKMQQCQISLLYTVNNFTLQDMLLNDNYTNLQLVELADNNVGPLLYNIILSNKYIKGLEIYSSRELPVLNDLIKDSEEVEETDWYNKTIESNSFIWWYEDNELFLTQEIIEPITQKSAGIIKMKIKSDLFINSFKTYFHIPIEVNIVDNGKEFIGFSTEDFEPQESYYIERNLKHSENWKVEYQVSSFYFYPDLYKKIIIWFLLLLIGLLVIGLFINFLAKSLLKRIFVLTHQMQEACMGDFNVKVDISRNDEIGILANSFNIMLSNINSLINKVYKAEIKQKELELNLLKAKINPHFLYNTLSTINWIAIDNNQDKISKITTDLSLFYRTALNEGRDISTIENEISNAKAYIELQLAARDNSFDVFYDIDPETLSYKTPAFILQPVIENAIIHGIDRLRNERGEIRIHVNMIEDIINLHVIDNGKELVTKYGEGKMENFGSGYGLRNVNERVKMLSGDEFGIQIFILESGTDVCIRIKAKL
ncbi:sensor histidine kinase [Metabacillus sp. Hm71]|uniref:sensor histidine kinase n=1 Tax=Metabacillus sp. Hm71 TaxID=3450743 RepID=UPI003F43167E